MVNDFLSLIFLAAVTMAMFLGCQTSQETGDDSSIKASPEAQQLIELGFFKLYPDPGHKIDASCDRYTLLTLENTAISGVQVGPVARLSERVEGSCSAQIEPNERVYRISYYGQECGTKRYIKEKRENETAGLETANRETVHFDMIDHRYRVCDDPIPAMIIVSEVLNPEGQGMTLYSLEGKKDSPPSSETSSQESTED